MVMAEILFVLIVAFVATVIYSSYRAEHPVSDVPLPRSTSEGKTPSVSLRTQTAATTVSTPPKTAVKSQGVPVVETKVKSKADAMPKKVGLAAGKVWKYLDKNGPTTVASLKREIKEEDKIIQRSLGWLAQEDKISIETVNRAETVSLKS